MTSFLQLVTQDLIRRYGLNGLEHCTLVFPMQRAGLFVKQYLSSIVQDAADETPIVLPHFTTIDALVDSLCPLQPDDEITSVCSLYEIYLRHTKHHLPIDAFYGWGVQLMNDFSSTDMALVDGDHFMRYSAAAAQLERTVLDEETQQRLEKLLHPDPVSIPEHSVRAYFYELWSVLPAIYSDFQAAQKINGTGTRGARTRWVTDHFVESTVQQRIMGRTYVFVGFNFLLAAERRLMQLFQAQDQALFYWDMDEGFSLDATVYQFIRQNIAEFGNDLPAANCESSETAITAIACQSSTAQAQYVHDWLLLHHHPGQRSAVVIADESLLQSVIYSLPSKEELDVHINITKGYPLRATHLFAHTTQYIQEIATHESPSQDLLPSVITDLEHYYQQLPREEVDSWQKVLLDESYYQIQLVLRQLHLLLQHNAFVAQQLDDRRVLSNLIRRKLESVTIPFHGEPITDVQIIGVLETRLLDFDNILILNVEEDIVPSRSNDRSFLPYDLRREYGMATREEESRIYAYNFYRLLRRAQHVTLTFSDSFTDRGKRTMSRFLMQMLCSSTYTIDRKRLTESAQVAPYSLQHTCFGDHPDDQLPTHLSPSSISTFITCPRAFYLQRIVRLSESSIEQVMLPPNVIGSLCHGVLQYAYRTMCNDAIDSHQQLRHPVLIEAHLIQTYLADSEALSQALDWAYLKANNDFASFHPESDIKAPYQRADHEAENYAILSMAKQVLQRDVEQTPFTLVWLEHEVRMQIHNMTIKGVIDRLDIVGQGEKQYIRVLDYKTGSYDENKLRFTVEQLMTDPSKQYALQTLIYSEMASRNLPVSLRGQMPIRPELFFVRKNKQSSTLMLDYKPMVSVDNYATDCQEAFLPQLEQLTSTITNLCQAGQEFIAQPDDKICGNAHCAFYLLCGRKPNPS